MFAIVQGKFLDGFAENAGDALLATIDPWLVITVCRMASKKWRHGVADGVRVPVC